MLLACTILVPFTKIDLEELVKIPSMKASEAEYYVSAGEKTVLVERGKYIKEVCEAYILERAKELGAEVTVEVFLDERQIPIFVEITSEKNRALQSELQKILMTDFDIPEENQKWIWKQESDSS